MRRLTHTHRTFTVMLVGPALVVTTTIVVLSQMGPPDALSGREKASVVLDDDDIGFESVDPASHRPTVEAAFRLQSYSPGATARLAFFSSAPSVSLEIVHAGTENYDVLQKDVMAGKPVTALRQIGSVRPGRQMSIAVGNWPSGLYFARLTAPGGKIGYAPFVLRPRRLGEHRIAVVLPTLTWQAYNFRDDDGDGTGDTWYADPSRHTARLARPFENRGTPHARNEEHFLRWLIETGRNVDYLSDRDLDMVGTGAMLAHAYDLLVFAGHHEYVTAHEYDVVTGFRDRGGNLMFLAANNFFCRVDIHGDVMTRVGRWRDLGRPEAQLVGVQYIDWNHNSYPSRPYVLQAPASMAWIFHGTGLHNGDLFCCGGIEIDARNDSSPPGLKVLATIPDVFGPGMTAEMSYYETENGAKVFAAGAFSLAGEIRVRVMRQIVENVWARLSHADA
jgi:hypothetical protein